MYAELAVVSSVFSQLTTGKIPVYEYQFGEGLKEHGKTPWAHFLLRRIFTPGISYAPPT